MSRDLLNNKKKGISLTEVLMAIALFTVVACGLSAPVTNSLYLTNENQNVTSATSLAKSYLKDIQNEWAIQGNFDAGNLITLDDIYTNNGEYIVTVNTETIETDDTGNVIVRRIHITYRDENNNTLSELFYDYNRPGNI